MEKLKAWLARPYRDDMDALHWFMFYGMLAAIAVIWALVLSHIRGALDSD